MASMWIIAGLCACISFVHVADAAQPTWPELLESYDPVAADKSVVVSGNARFTVLTPRLIRMEYSDASPPSFEDRATTAFVNRRLAKPVEFQSASKGGILTITTSDVELQYHEGTQFAASTLSVSPTQTYASSAFQGWSYGAPNTGNLLGTIRTLDMLGVTSLNCTENSKIVVHDEDLHCAFGLISKQGYAAVDDSSTYTLDPQTGWWAGENADAIDTYLFAHGHDYKGALADFVQFSGRAAMPPRPAMGVWWTRWYNFNAGDTRKIVSDYETHALPLDVFVLDMDWHVKPAWGSYSWDKHLFPEPSDTMKEFMKKKHGLITLVNVHDDNGIASTEDQHAAAVEAMGLPKDTGDIAFQLCNNLKYALALEDAVLQPLENDGVDYFWIDWQQGGKLGGCAGKAQNPTIWTNKLRSTDHLRRGSKKRGLVLARWGGLGSHRYPVGFSGDVIMVKWDTLAYQPYFSMTATNVAYGFWSHDIVGPSAANVEDLELYTRWLQWGAYSGVLRSHDRGMSAGDCAATFPPTLTSSTCGVVRPWNVPLNFFEANQKALQRRAQLLPYVYTLARETFDKGLGPLRPMYYEFPELSAAYGATQFGDQPQYFFGGDMIVSPIVAPASENSSYLASKEWWIPPGTWVDHVLGSVIEGSKDGSTYLSSLYALDEIPVIMKAGAIVPISLEGTNGVIGAASRQYSKLAFDVYPHASEGATTVYMDDGETTAYLNSDGYAFLDLAYARSGDGNSIEFNATYDCCVYPGQPEDIAITLRLVSMPPLAKVSAGGQNLDFRFERYASNNPGTWTYNGAEATLILQTTLSQLTKSMTITFSVPPASVKLDGIQGEILRANKAKQALDVIRKTPGSHQSGFGQLDILSTLGDVLSYTANDPDQWTEEVSKREAKLSAAIDEVQKINLPLPDGQRRLDFVRALLKLVALAA